MSGITYPDLIAKVSSEMMKADGKFSSILNFINSHGAANTLQDHCSSLYVHLNENVGEGEQAAWLFDGAVDLDAHAKQEFRGKEYPKLYPSFVDRVIDKLVEKHGLLAHFRTYLTSHLLSDFQTCPTSLSVVVASLKKQVEAVQECLKNKVLASLIIGGYRNSGSEDNSRYPGIGQYLRNVQLSIGKEDVMELVQPTAILHEIVAAVQSTPFFKSNLDYQQMAEFVRGSSDEDLFRMEVNSDFARYSGCVGEGGNIILNWDFLRDWMFGESAQLQEDVLKAYVRTQYYRSIFFNPDDFLSFSFDNTKYWCKTRKSFVDNDGNEVEIDVGDDGTLNNPPQNSSQDWEFSEFEYNKGINGVQYVAKSNPIDIVDDKFIYGDVEFYVMRLRGQTNRVSAIYFNEKVSQTNFSTDRIKINAGKFNIGGIQYSIQGNAVVVRATGDDGLASKFIEFSQEIKDDHFTIAGVEYVLHKENETYAFVEHAKMDGTRLVRIPVSTSGRANYGGQDTTFQFSDD